MNGVGGDELRSGSTGEREQRRREEHGESERRSRGLRGVHSDVQASRGGRGKQELAVGGRARAGAPRAHAWRPPGSS